MNTYPFGLCDLHCDTLYEMAKAGTDFYNTQHHISFDMLTPFTSYTQVMAIWSRAACTDEENWENFHRCRAHMTECLARHPEIALCKSGDELSDAWNGGKKAIVLAVEGGALLGGDLSRVDMLYECGVRFLTLVWGSVTCMGGAHNVGGSLSDFGVKALDRMLSLGIIPDVSHSSKEIFWQTAEHAKAYGMPFVATHSNSAVLTPHTRNLTDEQFLAIRDAGGLVGMNYYIPFLTDADTCSVARIVDHMEHFLALGGESVICLGSDCDGIDAFPTPMRNAGDTGAIADEMRRRGWSDILIADIFENNVKRFLKKHLK